MEKAEAIRLLGGTVAEAARSVRASSSAVSQWPEILPQRIEDRVQAALWRMSQRVASQEAVSGAAPLQPLTTLTTGSSDEPTHTEAGGAA